jgi:hypothetical protein
MFSIGDLVGKKITDELWISYRQNLSVGKTMKSCSACSYSIIVILDFWLVINIVGLQGFWPETILIHFSRDH